MNKELIVVCGPTASGKSDLAIQLARKFNGEIISADSRQIYKYMDIGTGKIPVNSDLKIKKFEDHWELNNISVWGYDLVTPDQFFSGYDFALFALNKAREIRSRGKNVFIVGGTGFYIDLVTKNKEPSNVEPDFELRDELNKLSLQQLQTKLTSLNILIENNSDANNPVRIIRAIEKHQAKSKNFTPLPYFTDVDFKYIGLKSTNEILFSRADKWVDEIWQNGLVDEVKNLINLGYKKSTKLQGLVYKSVVQYLSPENTLSQDQIKQLIKYDIHAYIRRQLTYFNKLKCKLKTNDRDLIFSDILKCYNS